MNVARLAMTAHEARHIFGELFGYADININGERSFDIQVHRNDFYQRAERRNTCIRGVIHGWLVGL